jgi:hypothetical protein
MNERDPLVPPRNTPPKVGDTLPNGARVLRVGHNNRRHPELAVVLADSSAVAGDPFATWEWNQYTGTYWGHYFDTLQEATDDFLLRGIAN